MTLNVTGKHGRSYPLEDIIGEGSYAVVYKGIDPVSRRSVAIKIPKVADSFKVNLEATLLLKSTCDFVVRYVDHNDVEGDTQFIAMEYVGETLLGRYHQGLVNDTLVQSYVEQIPLILGSLAYKQVAHCDLKCSNIGITNDNVLKVMDLGLAIPLETGVLRQVSRVPTYCPPEFQQVGIVNLTTDTYMAGKSLEFLLTGMYGKDVNDSVETLELWYQNLPSEFVRFFAAMIEPDVGKRPHVGIIKELSEDALRALKGGEYFTSPDEACMSECNKPAIDYFCSSSLLE